MKILQDVQNELNNAARSLEKASKALTLIHELGVQDFEGTYYSWSQQLTFDKMDSDSVTLLSRILLQKVKEFKKNLDENDGTFYLTAEYVGLKIKINYAPPSGCTIKCVEEEIIVPETKKIVKHYVSEGNCMPILAGDMK